MGDNEFEPVPGLAADSVGSCRGNRASLGTTGCLINSASVFSPFKAASATFALDAGLWFRRGRLLISTPIMRPPPPPSGRISTYHTVQIC